jgi:hypothetical protein
MTHYVAAGKRAGQLSLRAGSISMPLYSISHLRHRIETASCSWLVIIPAKEQSPAYELNPWNMPGVFISGRDRDFRIAGTGG